MVINTFIIESTVKINYTTFYCVKEVKENQTDFVGVIQKRSEEKIDDN